MGSPGARLLAIATPIGNLGDLSDRARESLAICDLLACEDTRRTGKLLSLNGISGPRLIRMDEHTESRSAVDLVKRVLADSLTLGLVSDAGMPGLSDPGAVLVAAAIQAGIPIEVIPGPFAGAVALVGSGLLGPDSRFVFEGFLSRRSGERNRRLGELASETRTMVFYESPHRLGTTLSDMAVAFGGDRQGVVARELTKLHETYYRDCLADLVKQFEESAPKGECVIVIDGADPLGPPGDNDLLDAHRSLVEAGLSSKDAIVQVARNFGVANNTVKQLVFSQRDADPGHGG